MFGNILEPINDLPNYFGLGISKSQLFGLDQTLKNKIANNIVIHGHKRMIVLKVCDIILLT